VVGAKAQETISSDMLKTCDLFANLRRSASPPPFGPKPQNTTVFDIARNENTHPIEKYGTRHELQQFQDDRLQHPLNQSMEA
jgi:hypothetical protein